MYFDLNFERVNGAFESSFDDNNNGMDRNHLRLIRAANLGYFREGDNLSRCNSISSCSLCSIFGNRLKQDKLCVRD